MSACILAEGARNEGYVRVRGQYAHRAAWEAVHGAIPEGYQLHHDCGTKACANVEHLRLLTVADHTRLHRPAASHYAAKLALAHCKHGHEYSPENTYRAPDGTRACRRCRTLATYRFRARRAE